MTTNDDLPSQAFENTSTNVAASQMRNALNNLIDTVPDPSEKKVRELLLVVRGNVANGR
jgi:UTP--glucose-1-phosphate uridylyltransferase